MAVARPTFSPGLDFFKKMIDGGILNGVSPSSANIQKGECPITAQWDFDALRNKDQNPKMNLQVVIPSDGTVAGSTSSSSRPARRMPMRPNS